MGKATPNPNLQEKSPATYQVTEGVNSLRVDWSDGIIVRFDKVRASHPKIWVESNRNSHNVNLAMQSLGLDSGDGRRKLAQELEKRYEAFADVEWYDRLRHSCIIAEQYAARRAAPVLVTGTEPYEPISWVLEPLLTEGHITILFGEKGTQKSLTSHGAAICLAIPWVENPFGWRTTGRPRIPLILDYETSRQEFIRNIKRIATAYDLPSIPLFYEYCDYPLEHSTEFIQEFINKEKIEVLIVDSKNGAVGDRELIRGETGSVLANCLRGFRTWDKRPMTTLLIDHVAYDPKGSPHPYGARTFGDRARNIWEVKSADVVGDEASHYVGLFHSAYNLTGKHTPFCFKTTWGTETIEWHPWDVRKVPEFQKKLGNQSAILAVLKPRAMRIKEIQEATGIDYAVINVELNRLLKKGLVTHQPNNLWGLPSYETEEER